MLFVPTGNAYCFITVSFGHINMADADERWGSQKKTHRILDIVANGKADGLIEGDIFC